MMFDLNPWDGRLWILVAAGIGVLSLAIWFAIEQAVKLFGVGKAVCEYIWHREKFHIWLEEYNSARKSTDDDEEA
jgi:hypothetical protein